jgi:hypothetical protein
MGLKWQPQIVPLFGLRSLTKRFEKTMQKLPIFAIKTDSKTKF